jgi:GNAT superfamily N-acetyltransferase
VYITEQDRRIDRLLSKSMTLIAYFPEAPDEILGWACIDTRANCAHYVYVKVPYRRLGIGTGLVRNRATCYSHGTDKVGQLFATHNNLTFNPYLVER